MYLDCTLTAYKVRLYQNHSDPTFEEMEIRGGLPYHIKKIRWKDIPMYNPNYTKKEMDNVMSQTVDYDIYTVQVNKTNHNHVPCYVKEQ